MSGHQAGLSPKQAQIIIFSFSKKECESLAAQMVDLDLNGAEEKAMIEEIFNG